MLRLCAIKMDLFECVLVYLLHRRLLSRAIFASRLDFKQILYMMHLIDVDDVFAYHIRSAFCCLELPVA